MSPASPVPDPPPPPPAPPGAAPAPRRRRHFEWGFRGGVLGVLGLMLWLELAVWLAGGARSGTGAGRWLYAGGFFLAVLPLLAAAVYRWPVVFGFFRSVKVGVVNLAFLGVATILGVLFHQEDPNFPIPPDDGRSVFENGRYEHYLKFRNAQAYFVYHVTKGNVLWLLPGTGGIHRVDEAPIEEAMSNLGRRLPDLEARFGEEFAVGIAASSRRGLEVRQEDLAVEQLEAAWDDFWWTLWRWADWLDLLRVYKSDWFAALWGILFLEVLSNTFRGGWRRLLRPGKWGFLMTHGGILLVIAGGFLGRLAEQRGILELHVGQASDRFLGYDRHIRTFGLGRPFAVRLDAFRADHFDVLEVVYAKTTDRGDLDYEFALDRQPKARVYTGQQLAYDRDPDGEPALRLEVLDYVPQAEMTRRIRPAQPGDRSVLPLARVATLLPGGAPENEDILSTLVPKPYLEPATGVRLLYLLAEDAEAARARLAEAVASRYGQLRPVTPAHPGSQAPVDVVPGKHFVVMEGDTAYDLEILQAVPVLRLGRRTPEGELDHIPAEVPPELQFPKNPAVKLRITGPGGDSEERWVLQESFAHGPQKFSNLDFRFSWDDWASPARARWMLFQLPDGRLLAGRVGEPDSLSPVEVGEEIPTDPEHPLVVLEAYLEGVPEWDFSPVAGADFFHPASAGLRLAITTPAGRREVVLQGAGGSTPEMVRYTAPGGARRLVLLRFHPDLEDLPFEWRSRLTMLEPEGPHAEWQPVDSGEIRVNDYLHYRGYRFFQTNARPDDPTYSGIGVVYDPGIEVVLAGLYLAAFGTIVVFILKPLATRRQRGV